MTEKDPLRPATAVSLRVPQLIALQKPFVLDFILAKPDFCHSPRRQLP